jgi:hypothetical protein
MTEEKRPDPDIKGSPQSSEKTEPYTETPIPDDEHDSEWEKDRAITAELEKATERSAAVLGAAILDGEIRRAINLRLCCIPDPAVPGAHKYDEERFSQLKSLIGHDDEDFEPKLGFKDQCRLAFCLGLIGPIALDDCSAVAIIRNRFAHRARMQSFTDDAKVVKACKKLKSGDLYGNKFFGFPIPNYNDIPDNGLQERFVSTIQVLCLMPIHIAVKSPLILPEVQDSTFSGIRVNITPAKPENRFEGEVVDATFKFFW